jgi:DNA-binding NarL/FixJ family response regulator
MFGVGFPFLAMVKQSMVKKRPRTNPRERGVRGRIHSKMEPEYWRDRLFRNSFTYRGDRHEVRHWSVKIQHFGIRKTFSLRATDEKQAATEACGLYKAIVNRGWESVIAERTEKSAEVHRAGNEFNSAKQNGIDEDHWAQRLIHRKYTETFRPNAEREFSVRVEHAGTGYYFPLGSDKEKIAAKNAARVYRAVVGQGWDNACKRFPRELSVAFRWSDNPLAWTYTTVLTEICGGASVPASRRSWYIHESPAARGDARPTPSAKEASAHIRKFRVGIVEADAGLRQALCWCINQQEGCGCIETFASAEAALTKASRHAIDFLLVSQNLPDKPGIACLNELAAVAPKIFGLLFSVFEDSEQLFKAAPGGAPCYVFRRTPATRILIPIEAALKSGARTREQFNTSVRRYFQDVVISSPIHGSANELSNLTPREHEILGLLSKGHPDKEIADFLRISTWTVHGHLKKIFEKLGAHNRTDAVVKYLNK